MLASGGRVQCLFFGKIADDFPCEVLVDLSMPWDGFQTPRNDISIDVMSSAIADKHNRMLVSQQSNEIKALHA